MLVLGHGVVSRCRLGKQRALSPATSAVLCALAVVSCSSGVEKDAADDGASDDPSLSVGSGTGPACEEVAFQGKSLAPDLLLVLKGSGVVSSEVSAISSGLEQFAQAPEQAGVGFAASYFPREFKDENVVACEPSDYLDWGMAFEFGNDFMTLPGSSLWLNYLDSVASYAISDTAMAPAMAGATQGVTGWALNHHDQNAAIVLVSDSEALGGPCPAAVTADVAQTVAAAASGPAAIRTYVITLGSVPALDAVALAGGSVAAQTTSASDVGATLSKVAQEIRGCAYSIPVPSTGAIDPEKLNVRIQGAAEENKLAQVPSAADCAAHQGGWYYDDPNDPRKILLCHESCADLGEAGTGVDVLLGCPTVEVPK